MSKKFCFDEYQERRYVMHCRSVEDAKYFCSLLHKEGRNWRGGQDYINNVDYSLADGGTCYAFNMGQRGTYDFFIDNQDQYTILEFDDFQWDGYNFSEEDIDSAAINEFLSEFHIS